MSDSGEYTTQRGFSGFARLEDTYGSTVRVQASSAAMYDAVWIFTSGGNAGHNDGHAHLDRQQAIIVRDALNKFLEYAEDPADEDEEWDDEDE